MSLTDFGDSMGLAIRMVASKFRYLADSIDERETLLGRVLLGKERGYGNPLVFNYNMHF